MSDPFKAAHPVRTQHWSMTDIESSTETEPATQISRRYRRLADTFTDRLRAVPATGWDAATPCADWTVRQIADHVVETQHNVAGYVGRTLPTTSGDDPVVAWRAASAGLQELLDDPATAEAEFTGMAGPTTLESAVDQFLCFDLIIHGWDIARATGQDERIDPGEVRRLLAQAEGFGDALRMPGGFGPVLSVPQGASEQDELLAFLGRQP